MAAEKNLRILIICQPGRKLENLISLAESIELATTIIDVRDFKEALVVLQTIILTILMIDYRSPESSFADNLKQLMSSYSVIHTLSLRSRNEKIDFIGSSMSDIVFDDLSIGTINNLIRNIQSVTI